MKYTLSFFLALSLITTGSYAQTSQSQLQCSYDQILADYNTCCTGEARRVNQVSCADVDYERNNQGTFPSSGQQTGPQNTQSPGAVLVNPPPTGTQAGSCSAIVFNSVLDILIWARCIIGAIIVPLLFTIAFVVFIWGIINYMRNQDNEKKREESKRFMLWGILALTVMVSVWGIVRIVTNTFGFQNAVPQLQTDCLQSGSKNPCR